MTSTPIEVGTTIVIAPIRANPNRISLTVMNLDGAAVVYIKEGKNVGAANGMPIYANGNWGITKRDDGTSVTEEYSLISDTLATQVRFFEGFKE
ncbi:unnamed protein product [marine sediment metagenome]|uniref:Uncharacterized protein n=1 Tax=marine sediment metagenome TaxID=412755 RepID=X1AWD3_9ZZZZ